MKFVDLDHWAYNNNQSAVALLEDGANYWVQNGVKPWSIQPRPDDTIRFEVRSGDRWEYDPGSKERSEIADQTLIKDGTPTHVAYQFAIDPGPKNTADWLVLGQFHQDDYPNAPALSPPFSVQLAGDKMQIMIGYSDASGQPVYKYLYTDKADIQRGHFYDMDVHVTFDVSGDGHLTVARDGVTLVNYDGPLGFATEHSVYWKEGVYRAASPETLVAEYRGLSVTTGETKVAADAPVSSAVASVMAVADQGAKAGGPVDQGAADPGITNPGAPDVAHLYYGVLGRAPDADGLHAWQVAVDGGMPLSAVAQSFLASSEYAAASTGYTNAGFVAALYQDVLGRAGAPGEVGAWTAALDAGTVTRADLARASVTSGEYQGHYAGASDAAYVQGLYAHVFGRAGGAGEVAGWVDALAHGMTRTALAATAASSAEFQAKYVGPGDAAFVDGLYVHALGRHADGAASAAWTDALAHGMSRADVAVAISEGAEAHAHHPAAPVDLGWHLA